MPVRYTWNGDEVKKRERAGRNKGLALAAQHLLGESTALVPWDEGTLQDNGTASVDERKGLAAVSYDTVYLGGSTA